MAGAQQALLVLAGIGLVAIAFVPASLIRFVLFWQGLDWLVRNADECALWQVADEDELRSGQRREGAFFGVNALITKPAQSIAIWVTPFILERTNFVTRASNLGEIFLDQPAEALMGIKIFTGVIPGLACLLGALILVWYPLRGERLRNIQEEVLRLHQHRSVCLMNVWQAVRKRSDVSRAHHHLRLSNFRLLIQRFLI